MTRPADRQASAGRTEVATTAHRRHAQSRRAVANRGSGPRPCAPRAPTAHGGCRRRRLSTADRRPRAAHTPPPPPRARPPVLRPPRGRGSGARWAREGVGSGARRRAMGVGRLLLSHLCPMSGTGGARLRQIGRPAAGDGSVAQRGGSPPPRAAHGAPLCCPARGDVGPMTGAGGARRRQIGRGRCGRRIGCTLGCVHADGSRIAFTNTCKCRRWCSG